jgi:hypothetical protein
MAIDASGDRRWVTVRVPTWLYGGDPRGFFADTGLTAKPGPDRAAWRIKTHEAYHLSQPDLVSTHVLVAAHQQNGDWSRLPLDSPGWTPPSLAHLRNVPPQPDELDLLDLLNYGRLNIHTAPRQHLQDACMGLLDGIRAVTLEEGGGPGFPEADLHVFGGTRSLLHRLKLPQVFLRLALEPDLEPQVAQRRAGNDEVFFKSSDGLLTGAYLLDAYLGPLLGALSPAIWGVAAPRGGQLIFNLGRQVSGTTALPSDLLGTVIKQGADAPVKFADLPPGSVPAALQWWADQLNQVFGVLSDPSMFATASGAYAPAQHMEALLTFEQVFRRVASIRTNHQDRHAAMTLMFSTIDTFENLLGRNILDLCHPTQAARTLSRLRGTIPTAAQPVLLPAADRAVNAVAAVGSGFFLTDREDRIEGGDGNNPMTREDATAHLLKLLRNATHGHGPQKGGERRMAMSNQLLARHDGNLPSDLALLGHLYLLELLSEPARLRRILR